MRLNDYIKNKNDKKMLNLMEIVKNMMVEEFGLNIPIVINNNMSPNKMGQLICYEGKNGIVDKFDKIEIRTNDGTTYKQFVKILVHEFCHIPYTNCHTIYKSKNDSKEDRLHRKLTEEKQKKTIEYLKTLGYVA